MLDDTRVEPPGTAVERPVYEQDAGSLDIEPEIGRYLVIEEVGQGGMGRVFRAYDPRLGREVALKRLHLRSGGDDSDRARMIREAKALALVSHPNVVAVYDVDVDRGALFISMEYVRGTTLSAWMRRRAPWREVVAMFVQAGRGLAAAHTQGIVHRDFKPSNVMVGDDGRPRVMDFGLARASQSGPESEAHEVAPPALANDPVADALSSSSGEPVNLGATLTARGTVVGTPAYMAPEQHTGEAVDARTDQYAFCVALWEALFGARVFVARDLGALAAMKLRGPPSPPAGSSIPAALVAAVVRGLAPSPEARWPDMTALLSAMERASAPRRWRWPAVVAGVTIVGGALAVVAWNARATTCDGGVSEIGQTWGGDARDRLERRLLASGASFAASTAERVLATLDAHASAWVEMHHENCEATRIRRTQSDEAFDLRMACLGADRESVARVVDLLASADASVTEHAIELVNALPPLERCNDVGALREHAPAEADGPLRDRIAELSSQLEQSRIIARAGRLDDALAMVQAIVDDEATQAFAPLLMEARVAVGAILSDLGRRDEARPKLEEAFDAALAGGHSHAAAEAAIELIALLEADGTRIDTTVWLSRAALGLAEGDGSDPRLVSSALLHYGETFAERELELEAVPYFTAAVERLELELGPDHPDLIGPLLSNAELLSVLERGDEALEASARALALAEESFGPEHPRVADALNEVAWIRLMRRDFEGSLAAYDRALAISEAAFGPDHPSIPPRIGMRVPPLAELGRVPEAIAAAEEALRRLDAHVPEFHPSRANALHNLATLVERTGDHERATTLLIEVVRQRRGIGHKSGIASALGHLGAKLHGLGRLTEAEAALTESLALDTEVHQDDGFFDGFIDMELAAVFRDRGELARALAMLEAGVVRNARNPNRIVRAKVAIELATMLWDDDAQRRRAVELSERALADLAAQKGPVANPEDAVVREQLRKWLDTHVVAAPEDPFAARAEPPQR